MAFLRGRIIAFSGIDGAGKSTQIDLIIQYLKDRGQNPVYRWTRGGYTGPFNALKALLRRVLRGKLPPSGRNEQRERVFEKPLVRDLWLYAAMFDLMVIYGIYFRILKLSGRIVIADRYLWDTWIDFRLNFPDVKMDQWFMWKTLVWITPVPDMSFLLLIPVEESLRRSKMKNEPFPDSKEVLQKRLALYKELSSSHDWHVLDCMQPIKTINDDIKMEITV